MSFGNIVGSLLQQGVGGSTQPRMQNTLGGSGLGATQGGGLDSLVGQFLGGKGGSSTGGGLIDTLGGLLNKGQQSARQNPNMAAGGLGAIAGALIGGASGGSSVRGAVGGGAMALLGTMAVSALQNWQANQQGAQAATAPGLAETPTAPATASLPQEKVEEMTSEKAEELVLRGMIQAAKADGRIGAQEMQRIAGKIGDDGVSPEEKQFVMDEMSKPLDLQGLINDIPSKEVGAEVYAAALLAIEVDTPSEQEFLKQLASGVGLDAATVQQLHMMTGAPAPA
ncbi:MAG: tellurite resistance TerB family protein [Pseudomonadota bacterium]